jgi:hypothetical protein
MAELFQKVARRVGDMLRRPVVSYANGREIVITFGQGEPPGPAGSAPSPFRTDGLKALLAQPGQALVGDGAPA